MKNNTLKLLHTADLHLGSPFMNLPVNVGDTLRKEQKDILFRIIKLCHDEAVDILLLAGDVFDRPHPDSDYLDYLENTLGFSGRYEVALKSLSPIVVNKVGLFAEFRRLAAEIDEVMAE